MISLVQNPFNEVQSECTGQFKGIHPLGGSRQRECGRSEDRRTPEGTRFTFGRIVFSTLAYHPRSVIARSVLYIRTVSKRIPSLLTLWACKRYETDACRCSFSSLPSFFFFFFTVDLICPSTLDKVLWHQCFKERK